MGIVLVKAIFESVTGLVEDQVVHDFTFRWDGPIGPTNGELEELTPFLVAFYNDEWGGAAVPLASYLSHELSRSALASRFAYYTVEDLGEDAGSPQVVNDWTLDPGAASVASLPAEVAVVLSMNATLTDVPERVGATRPAARRRGRLYFGPLTTNAMAAGVGSATVQRPSDALQDELRAAAWQLHDSAADIMALNAGLFWSVYSTADLAARTIVAFSTDNAFDTQRRRGSAPTARQTSTS